MFLPTKVLHPYERVHYVTYALLGANVAIWLLTLQDMEGALRNFALDTYDTAPHQLITSMFLHAGPAHLLGNMLFLVVYGRYVEERLGPLRFAGAYLLFGLVAGLFYLVFSQGLAVGASGAISGLMGFVLVGAPWAQVRVLFLFYFVGRFFNIEAFWMVGMWIGFQVLYAVYGSDNVAYSAHFGGFFAGCGLAALMQSPICEGTDWWLDPSPPEGGVAAVNRLKHARRTRSVMQRPLAEEEPMHEVAFESLEDAPSAVAVIKLLMRRVGLGPEDAKRRLDAVRDDGPQHFAFADAPSAESFAEEARALGVRARSLSTSGGSESRGEQ